MNNGKIPRVRLAAFVAALTVACAVSIGILPAQSQSRNPVPDAARTKASPIGDVQALPSVVVTGVRPTHDPKADKAWRQLERAEADAPNLPIGFCWKLEFQSVRPEDVGKFLDERLVPDELSKADKARDFSARFPNYPKVWDARIWEYENMVDACAVISSWNEAEANLSQSGLLVQPQVWSHTNLDGRLMELETSLISNTNLSQSSQFRIRRDRVNRLASGPGQDGLKAADALRRDFPQQDQSYDSLRHLIARSSDDQERELAQGVINGPAPERVKALMRTILGQLDLRGKPVSLSFTALDGRKVDTATMRGKVVLIAFWEPDEILELSSEKALYERFHAHGMETIGICLGQADRNARLKKLLKAQNIPWPQYFDGAGLDSEMARRFGIYQSPTLLLLDKHGILREINSQTAGFPIVANGVMEKAGVVSANRPPGRLEERIKKLLAESPRSK